MSELEEGELPFDEEKVIVINKQNEKPRPRMKKRDKNDNKLNRTIQLNNSPPPLPPMPLRYKKKDICKFHLQKTCVKGKDCPFEHDFSQLLCRFYYFFGECVEKESCRFYHGPIESDLKIRELVELNWDMITPHPTHYFRNSPIYQKLKTVINQKKFFFDQNRNPISFQQPFMPLQITQGLKESKNQFINIDELFEILRPPAEVPCEKIIYINKVYDNMFAL